MADSPEVKVRLTAEDTGVAAAIRQLGQELKTLKNTQDDTASSSLKLGDAFKSLLGAIAIDRVIEYGREIMKAGVEVGNLAAIIGVSSSTISVFRHVSEQTGTSWDRVSRSLAMGARRITEFQGGEAAAAEGMKLLGLTVKQFQGLNADQKLRLMVEAFGKMPDGFKKAAAAQILFSRGGREMVVVADALARQGFGPLEEELRKTGALMDDNFTNSARIAQAAMHDLSDEVGGAAVRFETGLLPELVNAALALQDVAGDAKGSGQGIEYLGHLAGEGANEVISAFIHMGSWIGHDIASWEVMFEHLWEGIVVGAEGVGGAVHDALRGQIAAAKAELEGALSEERRIVQDEHAAQSGILADYEKTRKETESALFPSPDEQKRRTAEQIKRLALDQKLAGGEDVPSFGKEKVPPIADAAAKAQLALSLKQDQDLLAVWKAKAADHAEVDKEEYEEGILSLKTYFDRRRAEIEQGTAKEIAVLKEERDLAAGAAEMAYQQAGQKKTAAAVAGTPEAKAELTSQADRLMAEHLSGLAHVDELTTRIDAMDIESRTKITALNAEQFKSEADNKQKILEFLKQIDELQGKTAQGAKEEAAARADEFEKALHQASPEDLKKMDIDPSKINELVAAFRKLTEAAGDFAEKEKSTQDAIKAFENQRADIEVRLKGGQISELQAHREITALLQKQIPLLTQKAQLELRAAIESGNEERKAQALQALQTIQNLNEKTQQMGTIGKQVSSSLTNDFQSLFMQLASGTKSASQAFTQFGLSVLKSLEEIAAQMLANIVVTKLMNTLGFGGNSQQVAKTIATNDMMITSNAGAAGAAAFASAMEALPFPANLAAAPAAMAAAIAETMSNIAFGSAAKGALLPSDMLVQAHAKEMILPADISTSLRSALDTGSIARPSDLRMPSFNAPEIAAGAGHADNRSYTGNVTVNQTNSKMSVEEISAAVRRGVRRGF